MFHSEALLRRLAQEHQKELWREAEAARRAALLDDAAHGLRLRNRLGRALIRLGGLLDGADGARHAEGPKATREEMA